MTAVPRQLRPHPALLLAALALATGGGCREPAKVAPIATASASATDTPTSVPSASSSAPPAASSAPTAASSAAVGDPTEPYRCARDADCALSCLWGAISQSFQRAHPVLDKCMDGCTSKGMTTRCEEGMCRAYAADGSPSEECTHRRIAAADRAWACKADADCVTSCGFGAVNAEYWRAAALQEHCDDGCSSKGLAARCVASLCTTVRADGQPVEDCTHRPLPPPKGR